MAHQNNWQQTKKLRQPVRDGLVKKSRALREIVFTVDDLSQSKQAVLPELAKIARRLNSEA